MEGWVGRIVSSVCRDYQHLRIAMNMFFKRNVSRNAVWVKYFNRYSLLCIADKQSDISCALMRLTAQQTMLYIEYIRCIKTSQMGTCVFAKTTLYQVVLTRLFRNVLQALESLLYVCCLIWLSEIFDAYMQLLYSKRILYNALTCYKSARCNLFRNHSFLLSTVVVNHAFYLKITCCRMIWFFFIRRSH